MSEAVKPQPRSPYIFEEGNSGGGPDNSGSSLSSSSSGSSMKFITAKLKPEWRTRLLVMGVVLVLVVVLVVAIATAVYFTTNGDSEPRALKQFNNNEGLTTTTTKTTTTPVTSRPVTTTHNSYTTSGDLTSTDPNTTSSTASYPTTRENPDVETTSALPETTTAFVDTSQPSDPAVTLSDIYYHPDDVKTITLNCQGRHQGNWNTLTLRRQFKDSYEPIAAAAKDDNGTGLVLVFYPNVTYSLVVLNYEITLILTIDPFYCQQLTNFTCAMDTDEGVMSAAANVSVYMTGVQMKVPHSIVEDLLITLECTVELFDMPNTSIAWKFRPDGSDFFMDFSVSPVTNVTQISPCTYFVNSTLSFTPTMYENGSDFRCEISTTWWNPIIIQEQSTGIMLQVLPRSFCDGKRQFSIHPHPNGPCTRVIYCLNTGPLVYEIGCEPGHCYDTASTQCVPQGDT